MSQQLHKHLCDGQSKGRSREHQTFTISNDSRRVDPSNGAGNDEIVDCQPSLISNYLDYGIYYGSYRTLSAAIDFKLNLI